MKPIKGNLTTVEYIDKRIIYSILTIAAVILLIISACNIHSGFQYHTDTLNYKEKITRLTQNLKTKKLRDDDIKNRPGEQEYEKIKTNALFMNKLITLDIFPWDKLLDTLEQSVPEGMTLNSFVPSNDFKKIIIKGRAGTMKNITHLLKMLEKSAILQKSSLLQICVAESNPDNISAEKAPGINPSINFEMETFLKMDILL
ncbi:MAG: PilN domain-containing protein [Deltaproteobacteria bacterium]|nr:PilN domain-containing protein [Deltaproteobacteria bacterium]